MSALKVWYGNRGSVVLELHENGALVKHEKSKDRLRVLGFMGHAVDEEALQEALSLGAKELFIDEDKRRVVWRVDLQGALLHSKVRPLAGVRRRCFDLRNFEIVEGLHNAPEWYVKRPKEQKEKEPPPEQLDLFGLSGHEKRWSYETS